MLLTVLGCYGPYPPAGQCCSGYLLQAGGHSVLLDCGNGVLSRLRYFVEPWELEAVIVSHLHNDHISDLMILRYAMMVRRQTEPGKPLHVYAPQEPAADYQRLSYKNYVVTNPLNDQTSLDIGPMRFTFTRGVHPVPSYLTTVEHEGKKLVYSGDTEFFPALPQVIDGADLFLCEANYLRGDIDAGHPNHMAAYQAARAAAEGGVGKLVLTHHHPDRDSAAGLREALETFPATERAHPGSMFFV
ncbi:MAG: MBL fold metallo-hydrolase [Bacillota bacterium]|nr:MBL fold metallo-hydrolase [Bacillota bacterium]MDW7683904.1 MBL fold metallo-hydrolase [Bacillota bacterium]